jgi:hypothetical protein
MSADKVARETSQSAAPKKRRLWRWLGLALSLLVAAFAWFIWWLLPGVHYVAQDVQLPVRFAQGLVYVEPETSAGAKLTLLADTGGGLYVTERAVERTGMRPISLFGTKLTRLPTFRPAAWIPEVTGGEKWMLVAERGGDGMLGQRWFAGGVWTFDYPAQKLILHHQPFSPAPSQAARALPLGFLHEWGVRTGHHPRFTIRVDGQPIESLLDTGATVWLSPEAMQVVGEPGESERATSFVSTRLFDRWHQAHPDWRVIEKGCEMSHEDLIEVPEVEVAGLRSGPVWFTRRGEGAYAWMSSYTDAPISASLGGNFFRRFRLTIDYPNAVGYLERE